MQQARHTISTKERNTRNKSKEKIKKEIKKERKSVVHSGRECGRQNELEKRYIAQSTTRYYLYMCVCFETDIPGEQQTQKTEGK